MAHKNDTPVIGSRDTTATGRDWAGFELYEWDAVVTIRRFTRNRVLILPPVDLGYRPSSSPRGSRSLPRTGSGGASAPPDASTRWGGTRRPPDLCARRQAGGCPALCAISSAASRTQQTPGTPTVEASRLLDSSAMSPQHLVDTFRDWHVPLGRSPNERCHPPRKTSVSIATRQCLLLQSRSSTLYTTVHYSRRPLV